jgi:hypothetical protein
MWDLIDQSRTIRSNVSIRRLCSEVLRSSQSSKKRPMSSYLLQFQRYLDLWDILVNPPLQRRQVNRLSHFTCHGFQLYLKVGRA